MVLGGHVPLSSEFTGTGEMIDVLYLFFFNFLIPFSFLPALPMRRERWRGVCIAISF